jgi:hypothetical protein
LPATPGLDGNDSLGYFSCLTRAPEARGSLPPKDEKNNTQLKAVLFLVGSPFV